MMMWSCEPVNSVALASSFESDACLSCHWICTRSSWRSTYSSVRYLTAVTAWKMLPAVSFLVSSRLTCWVATSSMMPMTATMPTEDRSARLSRVAIFIPLSSMNDRHGCGHHCFQRIEVEVIQVIGDVGPVCQLVLDRPARFVLQREQQALVQRHVELEGGPQLHHILEAHVDRTCDDLVRRVWLIP